MRAGLRGDRDERVVGRPIHKHPGRVVRGVDHDQPRRRRHLGTQPVDVDRPAFGLVELVEGHVGPGRPTDLVEALVGRPGHDRVVTRPEEDVREAEDRLLGTGEGQDLVSLERLVESRDLAAQERMAGRFRVAELEPVPQGAGLVVGQG